MADPLDLNHITIKPDQAEQAKLFDNLIIYQAESVILDIFVKRRGSRVAMPTDAYTVMSAWIDGAPNTLYIEDTGSVVDAAAGKVRHILTPAEANLAAGTYKVQVQAFEVDDTRMGVIADGELVVNYSPSGSEPYVAPTGTVLADLVDVSTTAPTDTQVLAWDAASALWAPATSGGGSGDVTEVQVSGGVLTVSAGTGPVPIVGLTEAAIQTAAAALPLAGGTMTGALNVGANRFTAGAEMDFTGAGAISPLDMGDNKITSVGTPSAGTDAANKDYSDLKLPLAGGTLTGPVTLATSATPSAPAAGSYTLYYDGTNLIGIDAAGVTTEIA
jgi:hypothetical protein